MSIGHFVSRRGWAEFPEIKIIMGGGYVNTELRELKDARVFDFIDFMTLDDGERPLLCLLEYLQGKRGLENLLRTSLRENGEIVLKHDPSVHDIPFRDCGTPTYDGLPIRQYLSLCELLNPMHRLWSDGRWNKLTLAHGCYWKKCSFCDISLDYIGRYENLEADRIVDRIEKLVQETGKPVSIRRTRQLRQKPWTQWRDGSSNKDQHHVVGKYSFRKSLHPGDDPSPRSLRLYRGQWRAGGSWDRLLQLMQKGVTVEQVARVTHAFTEAGIMVHAYLMFGFPTQTVAETVDSLERVGSYSQQVAFNRHSGIRSLARCTVRWAWSPRNTASSSYR